MGEVATQLSTLELAKPRRHVFQLVDRWAWVEGSTRKAAPAKRAQQRKTIVEITQRLGLAKPLGARVGDQWTSREPSKAGQALVDELRSARDGRLMAIEDSPRLRSALDRFSEFLDRTERIPFVDPHCGGGKIYNQETLDLFAEDVRQRGSRAAGHEGERIAQGTVGGLVSAIKVLRERREEDIVFPEAAPLRKAAAKHMRMEDGAHRGGPRRLCRAFRAHHFRECVRRGIDRSTARGMMEWAAALLAHNVLLRAGELGCVAAGGFDPARDITWGSFHWQDRCYESRGCPWFTVDVVAIKDTEFRHVVVPMQVRRRAGGHAFGADALCTYDAVLRVWRARQHLVPERERTYGQPSGTAFFMDAKGKPWTSRTSREVAGRLGVMAGIPLEETGGKMWRIGGATELRVRMGTERARMLLVDRGRWMDRDIGYIYSRALVQDHLDASAAMGDGEGSRDMEEVFAGWVQPANFR